jgi:hypothetical protein
MDASSGATVTVERAPAPIASSSFPTGAARRSAGCLERTIDPMLDDLARITSSATPADASIRFDALLRRVGRSLCHVFGLTRCAVYLTADALTFRGLVGFDATAGLDARVRARAVHVGTDLVTAELVRTRAPVVVADARTDARPLASVVRRLGITDLVAVPLVVEDRVIGAVYLDDAGRAHQYSPVEVASAASLARRASLIVRQGQVVLTLRRCLDKANEERQVLERATSGQLDVDVAAMTSSCPTQLVAHVSEALGRPVLLLGPDQELLHVAGTDEPFAIALRAGWRGAAFVRHLGLAGVGGPATGRDGPSGRALPAMPAMGLSSRQLASVIGDPRRPAGALVALEVGRPFDIADRRVLDRATTVLRLTSATSRSTGALGTRPPPRERISVGSLSSTSIGDRVGLPAVVVWLDHDREAATHTLVARLSGSTGRSVRIPQATGTGIVVPATTADHVTATLRELVGGGPSGSGLRRAVVSRVALTNEALASACAEVDAVVAILERNGVVDRVVAIDEIGGARLVLAAGTAASIARIVDETLTPLGPEAVGVALSTVLLDTVRTLIATDGSIREAARRLDVHENTVRYRVRRIRELTDLDVSIVGDLFQLQVAMCAREQLGFSTPPVP